MVGRDRVVAPRALEPGFDEFGPDAELLLLVGPSDVGERVDERRLDEALAVRISLDRGRVNRLLVGRVGHGVDRLRGFG